MSGFVDVFEAHRATFFYWVPVSLGIGIGWYFALMEEPPVTLGMLGVVISAVLLAVFWKRDILRVLLMAVLLIALGFALANWRAISVAAPILETRYYGGVEGRVRGISRSYGNALRVTLDEVVMAGFARDKTPTRVRISLLEGSPYVPIEPGTRLMVTANLSPPSAPAEPGGFDFRRLAWFDQLGAIGYARTPPLPVEVMPETSLSLWLFEWRKYIADNIRAAIPDAQGAFAAAILTGDRSEIDPGRLSDLRASNLAHLLAISGLHMGLLTGFVMMLVRYGLVLIPRFGVALPVKKIAAMVALIAGAAYLALSGASVATQRAFIMAAVVFGAILVDRQALTLRSVALAAIIVLIIRPESLMQAGFQMSFAATTGLVVGFQLLRSTRIWEQMKTGRGKILRPVFMLIFSSAIAGAATAPFSAFHFNQIAQYGLFANLLAVPMMGMVVMPAAVAAALLSAIGLEWIALSIMGLGIRWILGVAEFVAGLEDAVIRVPAGGLWVLPCLSLGALLAILLRGRIQLVAMPVLLMSGLLWVTHERPHLLVSADGRVFGVKTAEGRAISHERGNGFAVRSWLENDGDGSGQARASQRAGIRTQKGQAWLKLEGMTLHQIRSKRIDPKNACHKNVLLLATEAWEKPVGDCLFYGIKELRQSGSLAVYADKAGWRIENARTSAGRRIWAK